MLSLDLWTDGACTNGQHAGAQVAGRGPGGWGAILILEGGSKLAISGYEEDTTNNRMELRGVIGGLEAIGQERASVTIHTDSSYVKNAHTQGWLTSWQRNGWISSRGDKVANRDLWEELLVLTSKHLVKWRHVRGHQLTHNLNTVADALAVAAKRERRGVTTLLP